MDPLEIIIIVLLSLLVALAFLWLVLPRLVVTGVKRRLVPHFGKRIYHLALYNDYYLINEVKVPLDEASEAHIDHLMFGEKYIYVIKDRFYDGALTGKEADINWMYYQRFARGGKYIANPFIINRIRLEKLALVTGLDPHLFINLIVVNDSCLLDDINTADQTTFIVKIRKLEKLIKALEARDIESINPDQLDMAVKDIYKLVKGPPDAEI